MSNSKTGKTVGENNGKDRCPIFLTETHLNYYSTLDEENKKNLVSRPRI